ncbi:MAG: 3-isopropylmalate dehydratase large subunit [Oceanococcus sp.]
MTPQTLFEKIWNQHKIIEDEDGSSLILIDRIFLHERTGAVALESLSDAGRPIKTPSSVFCTMDHIVDTTAGRNDDTRMPSGGDFIRATRQAANNSGIRLFDLDDPQQGIVHVISPELGIVLPGLTLVCPDSHTCTQGALGALAWGIGSSEAEHALATQTLRLNKPKTMRVNFEGTLPEGVTAKDMILHLIGQYGASGGSGYVLEFAGSAVRDLAIEARMTLCNMAVEFSAFSGLIAADEKTFSYLKGREHAPSGEQWEQALAAWGELHSDDDARFDAEISIDCSTLSTTVTWGTSPEHTTTVAGLIPDPANAKSENQRTAMLRALAYQDLQPGQAMRDLQINSAFIGSCTNSRLSDLRAAAAILKDRKVAEGVKAICVPGSSTVKRAAEAEGLHLIFQKAGFEWRESGCSMCFFAGGESMGYRERVISTTNRNFESRQGPETRSHLASPVTVAASAVLGRIGEAKELS